MTRRLFKKVENALRLGTFSREDQLESTNEAFTVADEHLRAYIANYHVTLTSVAQRLKENLHAHTALKARPKHR